MWKDLVDMDEQINKQQKWMSYQISKVTQIAGKASDAAMKNELDIGKLPLKITDIRFDICLGPE